MIYDLDDSFYLHEDIEATLENIASIYKVQIVQGEINFYPIRIAFGARSLSDKENTIVFNKMIPIIKSITKDMYAILESSFKSRVGSFEKIKLETQYPNLKELRLLNNKFKHFKNREAKVSVTQIALLEKGKYNLIDCYVNYKYLKTGELIPLRFADLIFVFLQILENLNLINVERG
ncbi:MAG: hypothetical protein RIC95_09385 [Vicingaceae bacterium]